MNPNQFSSLITEASIAYKDLDTKLDLTEEIQHLLLQSANHYRIREKVSSFVLGFFALERIIREIWVQIAKNNLVDKGLSKKEFKTRIEKNHDWKLSLVIDTLTMFGVLTIEEGNRIHQLRKIRNKLAHGGKQSDSTITTVFLEELFEFCIKLLKRVDKKGNIVHS